MEMTMGNTGQQIAPVEFENEDFAALDVTTREGIARKAAEVRAKNNNKRVFVVVVEGDTKSNEKPYYVAYLRRPNMMEFSQYMNFVQKDVVQASSMLAKQIFLDGDRELVDDEDLFVYGTMQQLNHVLDSRNGDIVKR